MNEKTTGKSTYPDYFNVFKQFYKFCPSCGALMDGEGSDNHA